MDSSSKAGDTETVPGLGMPMEDPEGGLDSTPMGEGGVAAAEDPMEGEGGVASAEEEEKEEAWKAAHKKYQDFQQTCEDLLDPGQSASGTIIK